MDSATKVLLTFRESATADECGNSWRTVGNPTIGSANSKFGSALQLDGASYVELVDGIDLGGQDFTIDYWLYVDASSQAGARPINTVPLLVQMRNPYEPAYLRLCFNKNADLSGTSVTTLDSGYDPTGKLVHIAVIYNKANSFIGLYVDGVLLCRNTATPEFSRKSVKIQIGYQQGVSSEYFLTGAISEFRVSDGMSRWITDDTGGLKQSTDVGTQWFEAPSVSYKEEAPGDDTTSVDTDDSTGEDTTSDDTSAPPSEDTTGDDTTSEEGELDVVGFDLEKNYVARTYSQGELKVTPTAHLDGEKDLVKGFTGQEIIRLAITLQEKTLSDKYSVETTKPTIKIGTEWQGKIWDYAFSFAIEGISEENGRRTLTGMYNQDELLYTPINLAIANKDGEDSDEDTESGDDSDEDSDDTENPDNTEENSTEEEDDTSEDSDDTDDTDESDSTEEETKGVTAKQYIRAIAGALGLKAEIQMDDFTPTTDYEGQNMTYREMLSSLFGWTSQVPRRQINVFIRGKKLYCLQRGKESKTLDISKYTHTEPRLEKTLVRTLYNTNESDSDSTSSVSTASDALREWSTEEVAKPFTGTIDFSVNSASHVLQYKDGFLIKETHKDGENSSTIDYEYETKYPSGTSSFSIAFGTVKGDIYLTKKKETSTAVNKNDDPPTKTVTDSSISYIYKSTTGDGIYLTTEIETVTTKEYEPDSDFTYGTWKYVDEETSTRKTFHVPLGNGWYGTYVTIDGVPQGSSISQGAPGNKVSPYTVNQVQRQFSFSTGSDSSSGSGSDSTEEETSEWLTRLASTSNVTFPISDRKLLKTLVDEVYWMNRATQERVTVELFTDIAAGMPVDSTQAHIVDLDKRVAFNNAEYFVESNQITLTARRLSQRLQLVRWYKGGA